MKGSFSKYKAAAICYYEDIRPEDREAAAIKNYKGTDELTATGVSLQMSRNDYRTMLRWANNCIDAYQAAYKQRLKELAEANNALFPIYPGTDIRAALKTELQLPPALWFTSPGYKKKTPGLIPGVFLYELRKEGLLRFATFAIALC